MLTLAQPIVVWREGGDEEVLAHLARTRRLRAGSIVGSGTVSQRDAAAGYGCIAEKRAREIIDAGSATTDYMAFGDTLRIEVSGADGSSVFGAIDQRVAPLAAPG